jgi:hypothetical protein
MQPDIIWAMGLLKKAAALTIQELERCRQTKRISLCVQRKRSSTIRSRRIFPCRVEARGIGGTI